MKNQKINNQSIIFKLLFILAVVFLFSSSSIRAATSPDAIAFRVMPNPGHLSPLRWYQENIKLKGSPQGLTVDGYEAVRDGRTVYVNAANIDLSKTPATFYSNIYIISYNQQAESATVDIFGQILARWKFNTNISDPEDNKETVAKSCLYSSECSVGEYCLSLKAKIIRDTKRLADLSDIKLVLDNYQEAHSGDYPALSAGSYVASTSLSVWPSWQATLAKELGVTLPVDPVNKMWLCSGYDAVTCWNQTLKKFAGIPANSHVYVYKYNGKKSYNLCAFMESGYLTTLQGACAGSAVGYKVTCVDDDAAWTYKYPRADVCTKDKVMRTSNCGRIEYVSGGKIGGICGCVDTSGKSCTPPAANNCGTHSPGVYDCLGNCPPIPPPADGTIVCSRNTDCDDGKACTTDVCNNPGKCNSSCGNTAISGTHLACSNHSCVATANTSSTCTNQNSCAIAGAACDCNSLVGTACPSTANNCGTYGSSVYYDCLGNCPVTRPADINITCNASGQPNCQNTASHPDNLTVVSGGSNVCCDGKTCYQCAAGYSWNGTICEVSTRPCAIPWGGTIAHGQRITAWQASSVAYGLDCVSESRLCTDSTLSGSYQSQACVAPRCGDGNLDAGNGEECDPPGTTANCTTVALTPCGNITVQGSKTCRSDCKWLIVNILNGDICKGSPPTTEENTSTLCDTSNKPLTDYACCVLTKCSQDGCACCGRGSAPLIPGFTSTSTMNVAWEPWSSRIPTPGWDTNVDTTYNVPMCPSTCQSATRCGQYKTAADAAGNCATFIKDALGRDTSRTTSNNCPSASCRLSQDLRSQIPRSIIPATTLRNWYVTTNDSTAYYKCWK